MSFHLTEHRTQHHHRLIALFLVLVAAGLVAYFAWQSSLFSKQPVVQEAIVASEPAPQIGNFLYFAAGEPDSDATPITYQLDIAQTEWQPIFDYPVHSSLSPAGDTAAFVTMPNIEVDPSELDAVSALRPAFVDLSSGNFNYLETTPGHDEQYYRLAPGADAAVAYMQRSAAVDPAAAAGPLTDWEVIIHRSVPLNNIVIADAAYPQWISATELMLLRDTGLVTYNIETGVETSLDLQLENYSYSNQYAAVVTPESIQVIMTATEGGFLSVFAELPDEETGELAYQESMVAGYDGGVFLNPVLSPDKTQFAVVAIRPAAADESGATVLAAEIQIYDLATESDIRSEPLIIPLSIYDPTSITLLGWR